MTKKMLIDAAHKEEVRVVVVDNERLDDFEVETSGKEQIKGNIYIGEVTRVEPSLQAAFISYGGNRNGFLAFSEVHPSFFDIESEEKNSLLNELNEIAERRKGRDKAREEELERRAAEKEAAEAAKDAAEELPESLEGLTEEELEEDARALAMATAMANDDNGTDELPIAAMDPIQNKLPKRHSKSEDEETSSDDDAPEETQEERRQPIHRRYAIQDVLKEGQKILIQVNKEERGNKGAALSTYISLPGRFCVLMPNTPYAGGISRKITDISARRELKKVISDIEIPDSMGLIVRTAGIGQEQEAIERDIDQLMKHWKHIDDAFETSDDCPILIHEDGSLPIRSVRDSFSTGIDEVIISGRKTYRSVKDYVKRLMPERAKQIKEHRATAPIFAHHDVEPQINRLHSTRVNLPSGGYLIINPTEALVSIDVNSGRATQEKNIEETAVKTNMEAAEEVARQLRLRDLAGLVVIDFIDMEDNRNERALEKAMRRHIRKDRARVQIAPISNFGLMEMSRQRLRPSLGESTMVPCPHCHGTGLLPSLDTAALAVLRSVESEEIRTKADRVTITTSNELALYILNNKRDVLKDLESRYKLEIFVRGDDKYVAPDHRLDVIRVDNRGNEKSQTLEINLRDNPDAEDNKKRRRRGTRGGKNRKREENQGPQEEGQVSETTDSKETNEESTENEDADSENKEKRRGGRVRRLRRNGRDGRRNRRDEQNEETNSKEMEESKDSEKAANATESAEGSESDEKKPRRNRRPRRNSQRERQTEAKNGDTEEVSAAQENNADNSEKPKPSRKKRSTGRKKRAVASSKDATSEKMQKEKASGITVETIEVTGKKTKEEGSAVTRAFQRWWGKGAEDSK